MAEKKPAKKKAAKPSPSVAARNRREARRGEVPNPAPSTNRSPAVPSSNPLMYSDLTQREIKDHERRMRETASALRGAQFGKDGPVATRVEGASSMTTDAIAGRFDRRITNAENRALAKTAETGDLYIPAGLTWYYEHNKRFEDIANDTGVSKDKAIAAGAKVSPAVDPVKTEVPAVRRISEFVSDPSRTVDVSSQASAHVHQAQTKENARNKQRRANPTRVDPTEHVVSDMDADAIAVLGSISGTRHGDKEGQVPASNARDLGFSEEDITEGEYLHDKLKDFRPLAAVRNRENVENATNLIKGNTTWDESHPSPMDQPGKTTSYAISGDAADNNLGRLSEEYNAAVHLHGESGMQYMLPFGGTETSAQDFWQKESAVGVEYDRDKAGKPFASAWDSALPKGKESPDLAKDNVTHAILNEANFRSIKNRPYTMAAAQSANWHDVREHNTKGSYAEPQRLSADAEGLFRTEQKRMETNRQTSRSDVFHVARQPVVQVENHPNQGTLDLGFKD